MIVHAFISHPRDAWCALFHVGVYLSFCHRVVVAVENDVTYADHIRSADPARIDAVILGIPSDRGINENGPIYDERAMRQAALDKAMTLNPSLIVFGDTDEVPTPDALGFIGHINAEPWTGARYYMHWVNLWGDHRHAIGGNSEWSFQNPAGNKKCFAMQPGGNMRYSTPIHSPMEPGRNSGGKAPEGHGHILVNSPKLLHLKYASAAYIGSPESKLARHAPEEMLRGGEVVDVPAEWLWEGMPL